jgi:hypothetical protein
MKTFEIGKVYSTRFASDYDSVLKIEILDRTEKTITAKVGCFGIKKLRVTTKYTGNEQVTPLGRYSMSPTVEAN